MVLEIGCQVAVESRQEPVVVSVDAALAAISREPPAAVLVARDVIAGPAWPNIRASIDEATPVIVVVDRAEDIATLPSGVEDFLVVPTEPAIAAARIEIAIRAARRTVEARKLSALGGLVAGVAHDVRNRLFGISATIDALANQAGEDVAEFVAVLESELGRLRALLNDVLDYGKASALTLERGHIRNALADAMRLSADISRVHDARVSIRVTGQIPSLQYDHKQLVRVFHNLITNAVQHAAVIDISLEAVVRGGRDGVACVVRDDGPGFAPAALAHAFEPFYTKRASGVGLGLAIVQRIVAAHRGDVHLANRREGGAEVAVWLPVN